MCAERLSKDYIKFAEFPKGVFKNSPNTPEIITGEYNFLSPEDKKDAVWTGGLKGCVAFIAFDKETQTGCLYHVPAIDTKLNDVGDRIFEKYF